MDGTTDTGADHGGPPPPPVRTWVVMAATDHDGVVITRTTVPDALLPLPWTLLAVCPGDAVVEASLRAGLRPWRRPDGTYRDAPQVRAAADALRIVSATDDHGRGVRDARWVAGWTHRNWGNPRSVSVDA